MLPRALRLLGLACVASAAASAQTVFIEAESLTSHGGWKLDTAFTNIVGSPYLLAHGLGKPVADAQGTAKSPCAGEYYLAVGSDFRPQNQSCPLASNRSPCEDQLEGDSQEHATQPLPRLDAV